jgi:uncharacterized protein YkwD
MPPVPLSPKARTSLVMVACVWLVGVATPAPAQAAPTRSEVRLFHALNRARASHGVVRLHLGTKIQTGAHAWARYLLLHDAFYHGSIRAGTSENIGWLTCRRRWAVKLVHMWMNSSGHRANLLDRSARRVGVGVATGRWSGYSCVRVAVTRFR